MSNEIQYPNRVLNKEGLSYLWTKIKSALSGKADKASNATNGNFASLDANGNLVDSGHKHSDYASVQSILREVPFSIATTDWTSSSGMYITTVVTSYVTSSSKDFVMFDGSIRLAQDDITTAKVLNGGGIVFTTGSIPAGTITGNIYTIGDEDGKTTVLVENAFIIKPFEVELDAISDASGAYSHTTTDNRVTEAMKPISIEYGNPAAFLSPVTVATGNGTITLTCSNVVGSSTVKVTVLPTQSIDWAQSAPTTITSAEADILADRIETINENISNIGSIVGGTVSGTVTCQSDTITAIGSITLTEGTWLIVACCDWGSGDKGYRQISWGNAKNPGRHLTSTITSAGSNKESYHQLVRIVSTNGETLTLYGLHNQGTSIDVYPYIYAIRCK